MKWVANWTQEKNGSESGTFNQREMCVYSVNSIESNGYAFEAKYLTSYVEAIPDGLLH